MRGGFKEFSPVPRGGRGGSMPMVYRHGKRASINAAGKRLLGIAAGDRYRLFVDTCTRRIGICADSTGPLVWPKGGWCAALLHALVEIGAPSECALTLEAVDLPPITHQARLR